MNSFSPLWKKTFGSLAVLSIVVAGVFSSSGHVFGAFSDNGRNLTFDGIIDCGIDDQAECPGYLTVLTSSTVPISIQLTDKIRYVNGQPQWGDRVEVSAQEKDGNYTGKVVRITQKYGNYPAGNYGTAGDQVTVKQGTVVSKAGQSFVIQFGSEYYTATIQVNNRTRFAGKAKSFAQVKVGSRVQVWGTDKKNGGFTASQVVVTK